MLLLTQAQGFDIASLKTVALVIFFALFAGVLLRLVLTRPAHFREAARLPLEEEARAADE